MRVARPVGRQTSFFLENPRIKTMLFKHRRNYDSDANSHDIELVKKTAAGIRGNPRDSEGAEFCSPEPVAGILREHAGESAGIRGNLRESAGICGNPGEERG